MKWCYRIIKKYLFIVLLIGVWDWEPIFAKNEISLNKKENDKESKILDERGVSSFQSYHKSGFKNAIKYNLIAYTLFAPSIIKIYEPLIFALPLLPNIIDGLAFEKLKKDLNLLNKNLINSNLKGIREKYLRSFILTNLFTNFAAYFFIDWLESGIVILS
ncbi:MAG: hypothetical protein ACJZ19_01170 [Candidatus Neomarinimicrobiota bacterium]